jgi:hypothetical protein
LTAIEGRYQSNVSKVSTAGLSKEEQEKQLRGLAKTLTNDLIRVGRSYNIRDLHLLQVNVILEQVENTVADLRKSIGKPGVTGDGHSNSAAAAEMLGWVHHSGQRHYDRLVRSVSTLTTCISQLDSLKDRYGVDVTESAIYESGMQEVEDCKKALADPKGYLLAKGTWKDFFPNNGPADAQFADTSTLSKEHP